MSEPVAADGPVGLILEMGPEAGLAAALLARRRGWRREAVEAPGALEAALRSGLRGPVVLVLGPRSDATDLLLDVATWAAQSSPAAALGVLHGPSAGALLAAADRWGAQPLPGEIGPQPAGGAEGGAFWGARMVGFEGSAEEARAFLAQPCELAFIVGHSNGLDIDAGPVTLCQRGEGPAVDPAELGVFPCFHGLPCGRCRPDQPQARPGDLAARRLILVTCWGMLLSEVVFTAGRTLGKGLLQNPGIEALITTVRVACIDAVDLPHLYFLANAGLPFGLVANEANQQRLDRGLRADFLCFGDPLSHLAATVVAQEADPGGGVTPAAADIVVALPSDVAEPVVLLDGEAFGVYDGRRLFLSFPIEQAAVGFAVVERSSLLSPAAIHPIALDLGLLADFLRDLGRLTDLAAASAAVGPVEGARDAVQTCFLADLSIGAVIPRTLVEEGHQELRAALEEGAAAAVGAIGEAMCRFGSVFPEHIRQLRYHRLRPAPPALCPYCASRCDADFVEDRPGFPPVTSVICRACGPIFHGDPALGLGVETPNPVGPGPMTVTFPLHNPYAFPVPACAVAAVTSFKVARRFATEACEFACSPVERAVVASSGQLSVSIEIPPGFVSGVYYLSAALVVGGRLQVFRRALHVRG